MSRIDGTIEKTAPDHIDADAPLALDSDLDITAPLDFLSSEQLATLVTVVRRPPEMELGKLVDANPYVTLDASMEIEMDPLTGIPTDDFTISVLEFVVRRGDDILASGNPAAIEGFEILSRYGRMNQHLHLAKIGQGGM